MNGYVGKILRIDLTTKSITTIDTKKYEQWGGGHGIGSALFWDLVEDKKIDGFDSKNVVTLMTSPLSGTLVPGSAARTEVQGIGVQSSPIGWFTRSNFGGRFSPMLKFAGWDGVVIEGSADGPVWLDIRDDDVRLRDARALWGKDTWETQQQIWSEVSKDKRYGGWKDSSDDQSQSTQRPAVLAIGQAGENLCRAASLVHDAGHGSGQGGFGAVWGSKKLKAISVMGTGSIDIANPKELMEARLWAKRRYSFNVDDPEHVKELNSSTFNLGFGAPALPGSLWHRPKESRPHACIGCHSSCRSRHGTGLGNESTCATSLMYAPLDLRHHSGKLTRTIFSLLDRSGQIGAAFGLALVIGKQSPAAYVASDLTQKYGINSVELMLGLQYLRDLYKKGVIGPGKKIACDLPFDQIGSMDFANKFTKMIAYREDIGDDMAEGFYRAAKRWGRLEEDTDTGLLRYPCWGLPDHYDARVHLEWGYGSILGDRDINEHDFIFPMHLVPCLAKWQKRNPPFSAKEVVETISEKLVPYEGDPMMLDYSKENMYSKHIVKLVAWHRHYSRFWKQSALYCNYLFADFCNPRARDKKGLTVEGEPKFYNAVTGKNMSFVDGMELGRKIWNLDNAIWTLQGRHRDMVHFAPYIYKVPFKGVGSLSKYFLPAKKNGKWKYIAIKNRRHDRDKFEEWKTAYYQFEGWDPKTGWPTRKTLDSLDMGYVADELQKNGRLGSDKEVQKAMQGKTVLITGADGGIGSETTKALAKKGATIVMACIDLNDAKPVYEAIKQESGNENIEMMQVDLASLSSIREFAKQFSQKYQQLHVLINNAGIFSMKRQETEDGFERTMGVNYLGHFLLTHLLLPIIKRTPGARILNVSSNAYFQGKIDLNDLHFKMKYAGFKAYGSSKLAVVLFTQELAERLKDTAITVNALHPGHAPTNIWNMWPGKWYQALLFIILKMLMNPVVDAAQNSIYLASSDEAKGITGKYFDNKKPKDVSPKCKDMQLQKGLWQLSENLTGLQ